MKKLICFIIVTLFFATTSADSQWVEKQRYKEIKFNLPKIGNGYLSEDGKFYYFTDGIAVIKLNIETGDATGIFESSKIGSILSFFITDNETRLYYLSGDSINIYDATTDAVIVSRRHFQDIYDDRYQPPTSSGWYPLNIRMINDSIRCFANSWADDYYSNVNSGYVFFFTKDSLKPTTSKRHDRINKYFESNDGKYVVFDGIDGNYNNHGGAVYSTEYKLMWFIANPTNTNHRVVYLYEHEVNYPFSSYESEVYYSFLPAKAFAIYEKSKRMVLIGSDGYLYDYDLEKAKFNKNNFVGLFPNMAADYGEKSFASSNDTSAVLFDLVANHPIDTVYFENKSKTHIISLLKPNEYLVFGADKSIKYLKFKDNIQIQPYIVADKMYVPINEDITFEGFSTGYPTSWHWKFSDGFESSGKTCKRYFPNPGMHWVDLTVSNEFESKTVRLDSINIRPELRASFYPDNEEGTAPLVVLFNNYSKGSISKYEWDFGDGTTSNEQLPTHTYTKIGSYSVSLTVWDSLLFHKYTYSQCVRLILDSLGKVKVLDIKLPSTNDLDSAYNSLSIKDCIAINNEESLALVRCTKYDRISYFFIKINHFSKSFKKIFYSQQSTEDAFLIKNNDTIFAIMHHNFYYFDNKIDSLQFLRQFIIDNTYFSNIMSQPKIIDNMICFTMLDKLVTIDSDNTYITPLKISLHVYCLMDFYDKFDSGKKHLMNVRNYTSGNRYLLTRGLINDKDSLVYVANTIPDFYNINRSSITSNNRIVGVGYNCINQYTPPTHSFMLSLDENSQLVDSLTLNLDNSKFNDFVEIDSMLIVVGNYGNKIGYYVYDLNLKLIDSNFRDVYGTVNQNRIQALPDGSILVAGSYADSSLMYYKTEPIFKSSNTIDSSESDVRVFPNPANSFINLVLPYPLCFDSEVEIYNTFGVRVILNQIVDDVSSLKIDVNGLPKGVYIVKCCFDGHTHFKKFIKF